MQPADSARVAGRPCTLVIAMPEKNPIVRDLLLFCGVVGTWLLLQLVVLPRLGFST